MAANRIKGITIEIGGDTTKLQTALKGVNTQVKSTQQQLKDVEKLQKLDPGNTELLAQKHKLLGEAVAAESLVGKNAMSGFLALMNAGEGDINKLSSAIANCDGCAADMAATMNDNLEGQLTILKSQLQKLAISFGEMLMPAIRTIVGWIQGFVDKLNSMDEGTRKVIITIALVAAAIGPVLIVIGKIMSAVGTIMTIIPKLASVIGIVQKAFMALNATMLANPIVLIIAAIAALVAAFIYLWNTNEEFRQFWIDLWEDIKEIAVAVWEGLKEFFKAAWEAIKATAEAVWNGIKDFFTGLWGMCSMR